MSSAVPDALAPPPGEPRFPALDGMRALAALSVLVFHAGAVSFYNSTGTAGGLTARGDAGVTIFFLLSGFLLYRPFVAARMQGRAGPAPARFYRRRLLRIVPAYWLALTALSLWPGLAGDPLSGDWWRYYLFLQNLSPDTVQQGIGPAWTLCVEVSFYALIPLYAALAARLLGGRRDAVRLELAVLALLFAASLGLRAWATHDAGRTAIVLLFTLPTFVTWFAAGMALAVLSAAGARFRARPALCWGAAAAVYVALAYALGLPRGFLDGAVTTPRALAEHVGYALVAALLLAPAVFSGDTPVVRRVAANRVATWLGLVSYGIYLYHLPLILEIAPGQMRRLLVVGGGVAIACAAVSYVVLERPVLRLKERPWRRTG